MEDIAIGFPDISPADNAELGAGAASVANALASVANQGVGGERWRRLVIRTVLKFIGESADDEEVTRILRESQAGSEARSQSISDPGTQASGTQASLTHLAGAESGIEAVG